MQLGAWSRAVFKHRGHRLQPMGPTHKGVQTTRGSAPQKKALTFLISDGVQCDDGNRSVKYL